MPRTYPEGWSLDYAVRGSEADGTARVPFAFPEADVRRQADRAEAHTGCPMVVIPEGAGVNHFAYKPKESQ